MLLPAEKCVHISDIILEHHFLCQEESMKSFLHGNKVLGVNFHFFVDGFCRWEFIQHVLSSKPSLFDAHFRPIYLLCSSCSYDFNYILRFEQISIEEPLFVQHLGAEGDFLDAFGVIKSFLLIDLL